MRTLDQIYYSTELVEGERLEIRGNRIVGKLAYGPIVPDTLVIKIIGPAAGRDKLFEDVILRHIRCEKNGTVNHKLSKPVAEGCIVTASYEIER